MISPAELEALMKSDTPHAVLDLRERGAYQKRHIFRATSLPRRLIEQRLPLLVPALPTPLVVCDDTGALSALAVPTLRAMGYLNVAPLAGGLDAWVGRGPAHRPGCQHAEQGLRRARAARPAHARDLVPRARPAHGRGRGHGHRGHAHARGVRARVPARRVEHAGWRAGAAPRRAGEAPGSRPSSSTAAAAPARISAPSPCERWACPIPSSR